LAGDYGRPLAGVVGEEIAVVPPVEPEDLGPQPAEALDHGRDSRAGASDSERRSTAPRKRTYSTRRRPRHLPSRTSKTTVASRISGKASTSDWSPAPSTTR